MREYCIKAVLRQYNTDVDWFKRAGIIDENNNSFTLIYDKFMAGKLDLKPEAEITVLRRLERLQSLGHWIDYLRSDKAKFRA